MEQTLFYILAIVTVIATILAITEKHPVHAIIYLVTSFFALAVVFYLLAAPLIAVFEVIIYAGAVMVLFMFVIMMLDQGNPEEARCPLLVHCLPALVLAGIILAALLLLLSGRSTPVAPIGGGSEKRLLDVADFAITLFKKYGVAIEIISMQLLFAIVGVLYLGRRRKP
ncbi:NADH-quinone oxidoreductase subunit J [Desulfopila sp. IMCC35006]|uniref:NADH-quinone oxidoreductase subunit J family protein n=1 Tax=Desulfopila sp. IMCC35006 TaxID=2569542 RepID=UPI0010ACE39A|nr:NADH-quinone oxidoreductase subunit J [Desulfopila sp. IMCC35006]TKB28331.1 NADH-quinone oxidoreductase subunit J [Desulfopila sp. IMCC35006]